MATIEQLRKENVLKGDNERLAIFINGKKSILPPRFAFNEYFDACSDSFECNGYPNNSDYDPLQLVPGGLEPISISILGETVLTGNVEILSPEVTTAGSFLSFSGRNSTFILEKSSLSQSAQREFKNMSLLQISKVVCSDRGLDILVDTGVNANNRFKRATFKDANTGYGFLGRLCKESGVVLTNTNLGSPIIRKAKIGNPVAKFDIDSEFIKFLGIESISTTYDTTKLYGTYIGKTQTPKKVKNTSTAKSSVIDQDSIKYLTFDDSTGGTLKNMVLTAEKKALREFFVNSIPYPSWENPEKKERWKAGQTIIINAKLAYIENKEVLINRVEFIKEAGVETAILYFKPVETYQ